MFTAGTSDRRKSIHYGLLPEVRKIDMEMSFGLSANTFHCFAFSHWVVALADAEALGMCNLSLLIYIE